MVFGLVGQFRAAEDFVNFSRVNLPSLIKNERQSQVGRLSFLSSTEAGTRVFETDEFLHKLNLIALLFDLRLLLFKTALLQVDQSLLVFNLRLLLFEGVDQRDGDAIVLDAFNQSLNMVGSAHPISRIRK